MPDPRPAVPISKPLTSKPDRLESGKDIATYLGREVRTIQLWERSEGLPIHRHQHEKRSSVYAFRSELDAWRAARALSPDSLAPAPEPPDAPLLPQRRKTTILVIAVIGVIAIAAGLVSWKHYVSNSAGETLSSIVVLPFLDLSPQKGQEYFSDGLSEEIIDALSRVPNLRVVARTSAFAFKGKAADIRRIGQQLNVDAAMEGSVRKAADRIRITAQLNRVSDGYHLWSRTYDRQLSDVFAVQHEISQAIAAQLRAGDVPHRQPTRDLQAYDLYQEGLYVFNQHQPVTYNKAVERYRQAIARDPQFALAYAGLADTYAYMAENSFVAPREAMPKAKDAAARAVALDPDLAQAHTSLAIVRLDYEWDRDGGQTELRKALELDPGSGYIHH